MFSALKNGESFTQIMGIEDYNNEAHLSQCIDRGCLLYLSLKRGEGNSFTLSWNYQGPKDIQGKLRVQSILAVENDSKWTYESTIEINDIQGEVKFEATLVKAEATPVKVEAAPASNLAK
jgi:hypothetical protein